MPKELLYQVCLVFSSFALLFVWQQSEFSKYTIPLIGFFIFIFVLVSIRGKKNLSFNSPLTFFALNMIIFLFIFSTGSLNSPLFFLLYFLLFGAAFVLDSRTVFLFPIGALAFFYPDLLRNDVTSNLLKVGSLFLISPLAYFFGKAFTKSEERAEKAEEIIEDIDEVIEGEGGRLSSEGKQRLVDAENKAAELNNEK